MRNQFSHIPQADTPRSVFDLSHGHKTTINADYLYPIGCFEVLPGDTWNVGMTIFARMTTPIFPIMDTQYIDTYAFFVPCRILWENWERFNGAQTNPGDSTDYRVPTVAPLAVNAFPGSIYDYFGIPAYTGDGPIPEPYNALPFRAYNLIWNEWFRSQDLQDSLVVPLGDTDDANNYKLVKVNKAHDYFTSCLPAPQKGPGVSLPITGGIYPVMTSQNPMISGQNYPISYSRSDGGLFGNNLILPHNITSGMAPGASTQSAMGGYGLTSDNSWQGGIYPNNQYVNLDNLAAVTINSLRMAFQIQKLYERDARGGTRYWEILRSHFNVTSPDSRLQRPEFLGHNRSYVSQHIVPQTSNTTQTTPQGNLAAFSTVAGKGGFSKSMVEHGFIIVLSCVRANLTYDIGVDRMWSRSTRFDYFWPVLQHIGEQAVLNKEIYLGSHKADNDAVFGYIPRYEEYKFMKNRLSGQMRTYVSPNLSAWHLAQKFVGAGRPLLNTAFLESNTPMTRVLAVEDAPHFIFDSYFDIKCSRVMSTYSIPGLVDHF